MSRTCIHCGEYLRKFRGQWIDDDGSLDCWSDPSVHKLHRPS